MENILRNNKITDDQREQVTQELVTKASIVAQGNLKRGNKKEYEKFQRIARRYSGD
jgi:hypothetical protein